MAAEDAMKRRLTGAKDSRGPQGIAARGSNVYNGGSAAATTGGGPGIGRPPTNPGAGAMAGGVSASQGAGTPNTPFSMGDIVAKYNQMQSPQLPQTQPAAPITGLPAPSNGMDQTGMMAGGMNPNTSISGQGDTGNNAGQAPQAAGGVPQDGVPLGPGMAPNPMMGNPQSLLAAMQRKLGGGI